MNRFAAASIALWMALTGQAFAQQAVVVELFTSQGCSSCPPADKLLHELAGRDDVIPLALHVDYWDYIGWKDQFAQPKFTKRQRGYARVGGRSVIYTPQMVINGQHDVVGNRPIDVAHLIAAHVAAPAKVELEVSRLDDQINITATALERVGPVDLVLVRYLETAEVNIKRGENAGRHLTYSHIVTDWTQMKRWNGVGQTSHSETSPGSDPLVVLVQGQDYGPIFAAARLR